MKVMAKLKVFQKYVKLQGQGHKVTNFDTMSKFLSQEMHMWNMNALSLIKFKLWPRLKFMSKQPMPTPVLPVYDISSLDIGLSFLKNWHLSSVNTYARYCESTGLRRLADLFSILFWALDGTAEQNLNKQ